MHKEWRGLSNEEELLRDELKRVEQQQVRAWAMERWRRLGRTFFIVLGVAIAFALANFLWAGYKSVYDRWVGQSLDALWVVIIAGLFFLLISLNCGIGVIVEFVIGTLVLMIIFMAPGLLFSALLSAPLLHNVAI